MTVAELCGRLQSLANEGYGIHAVELLTECDSCTSDVVVDNPRLEILRSDKGTVKLLFRNEDHDD